MALMTTQALVENAEKAINAILSGGQSYSIGDRRYTRADLGTLQRMRRQLASKYYTETSGPARNYARFKAPQ